MEEAATLGELRQELAAIRLLLEEVKSLAEHWSPPRLRDVIQREAHRAERYNHYFALVVVASREMSLPDLLERVPAALRASDAIGVFGPRGRYWRVTRPQNRADGALPHAVREGTRSKVGILLPETDRSGAGTAVNRLSNALAGADDIRFGTAVYPEDGTEPDQLIQSAVTWSHARSA